MCGSLILVSYKLSKPVAEANIAFRSLDTVEGWTPSSRAITVARPRWTPPAIITRRAIASRRSAAKAALILL